VVNGRFSIIYDPKNHVGVNLEVQPDGSFNGSQLYMSGTQQAQLHASGRISGNILEAQMEGVLCAKSYRLIKH
jgi:hypothetical protein